MNDMETKLGDVTVLGRIVDADDGPALRQMANRLRESLAPAVIMLGANVSGQALLVCSVSRGITDRFCADNLIKEAARVVGGIGGGRPDYAQAGSKDASRLAEAVETVYAFVQIQKEKKL